MKYSTFRMAQEYDKNGKIEEWIQLFLVCEETALRERMEEGGGIDDENWIKGSCDYNRYFMKHNSIGDTTFEVFDITDKNPLEISDYVIKWVRRNC